MGDAQSRTPQCPECGSDYIRGVKYCAHCGTMLTGLDAFDASEPLPTGTLIGSYRIVDLVGEGGMGRIYVAEHVKLGRRVAIKMLRAELVANPAAVARFFAEARAVNRISHENIVEITDFVEQPGGDNCIVMELLKGEDLGQRLLRKQTISLSRALDIGAQTASALAAVHAAGIIHRDLKPDNIFLIERGGSTDVVKLLDFGVAKLGDPSARGGISMHSTAAGQIIGTPEYMSPEQAGGQAVDFRTDMYALGVIFYEMLTGTLPFQANSFGELLIKHMTEPVVLPPAAPGLPHGVQNARDQLLEDLLAKDPNERPRSMSDVEQRMRELADTLDLPALPKKRATTSGSMLIHPASDPPQARSRTPDLAAEADRPKTPAQGRRVTPSPDLLPPGKRNTPSAELKRGTPSPDVQTPVLKVKLQRVAVTTASHAVNAIETRRVTPSADAASRTGELSRWSTPTDRPAAASSNVEKVRFAISSGEAERLKAPVTHDRVTAAHPALTPAPGSERAPIGKGTPEPGDRGAKPKPPSHAAPRKLGTDSGAPPQRTGSPSGSPTGTSTGTPIVPVVPSGVTSRPVRVGAQSESTPVLAAGPPATAGPRVGNDSGSTAALGARPEHTSPVPTLRPKPQSPPSRKISPRLWLAVGGGVTVLAIVLWLARRGGDPSATPIPAEPATLASRPVAPVNEVKIKFVSAPPGATVRIAGTSDPIGITPFTKTFLRSDVAMKFQFEKPGFVTLSDDISLASDDALAVAMTSATAVATRPAVATPSAEATQPSVATPPAAGKPQVVKASGSAAPQTGSGNRPLDRNGTMDVFGSNKR